ncbi:MAG TPA: choice-of-anchor B family protein [Actinomycetota bacterium]|nr:choice-of-anchor B family protein [Actinomycetota bacterium]
MRTKVGILAAVALAGLMALPQASAVPASGQSNKRCVHGRAGFFPCRNVDLQAFVPIAELGGGEASDMSGWVDPKTHNEYALMGSSQGLKFIDVTSPTHPIYLGTLIKPEKSLVWQDVEVYKDHAFVVCDLSPCGMQIFDLTRLRAAQDAQTWTPDLVYPVSASTHTIDIDPATGHAFLNGSYLSGGSQIVDVSNPLTPIPIGAIQDDGYTHDSHCRIYKGDDKEHRGHEVCFNANEDTITTYDLDNPAMPEQLSRVTYKNATYTHQAWLTKDGNHILVSDEIDEETYHYNSTTYIFDVSDLEKPKYLGKYVAGNPSIDHNNYIVGDLDFQASYTAGLRVLDLSKVDQAKIKEVGYFDVVPETDAAQYDGTWGVYPFLPSGNVLLSGMGQGFFIVKPRL